MDYYKKMQDYLNGLIIEHSWQDDPVEITVKTLSPEEAIGNPEHSDYPLIKGRERMMQAKFHDEVGQAFTDMFGAYSGSLADVARMEVKNNYRRAILVTTLNAVMRHLKLIEKTAHCKDDAPPKCARDLVSFIRDNYGEPKIAMVGLQPRMVEALASEFSLRVADMDSANIGLEKFGVVIDGPESNEENINWCDVALVTGTVFTNATLLELLRGKPTIYYGVTVAGAAKLFGLTRYCPLGF